MTSRRNDGIARWRPPQLRATSYAVLAAYLAAVTAVGFVPTRAEAQSLDDCDAYVAAGDWTHAESACGALVHDILLEHQAEGGSYCDSGCDHVLGEQPDPLYVARRALTYSQAAEALGEAELHLHRPAVAAYWFDQAVSTSTEITQYSGSDVQIRRISATARADLPRERQEASAVQQLLPKPRRSTGAVVPRASAPRSRAACPTLNHDASVRTLQQVDYPQDVKPLGLVALVQVKVHIDSDGSVGGAKIQRTSGDDSLDAAALRVALNSTYEPAEKDCHSVPQDVLVNVNFDPKQ